MRRRDVLALGAAMAGTLAVPPALRSQPARTRAAVVIGVDKAGDLPKLSAAVSGARSIAKWLEDQGFFEVKLFVDDGAAVTTSEVYGAVDAFVRRGIFEQLVIYFSGHGFLVGHSERWLLTGAPDNPNEAISLAGSIDLARGSGIPNVVFISDACRSTADSLRSNYVDGHLIFPNRGFNRNSRSDIDLFFATTPGDPSYEAPVARSSAVYEGIFTSCFLSAYQTPDPPMVQIVGGLRVVPNNRMRGYLAREVPKRAAARSIMLDQTPDTIITSGDSTYIGRAADILSENSSSSTPPSNFALPRASPPDAAPPAVPRGSLRPDASTSGDQLRRATSIPPGQTPSTVPTMLDVAARALADNKVSALGDVSHVPIDAVDRFAVQTGFAARQTSILIAQEPVQFETQTGFTVLGAPVALAATNPRMQSAVLSQGGGSERAIVRVDPGEDGFGTVALRFADGQGTVLAALKGFVGTVAVDERGGVSNVSYVPARNGPRWGGYAQDRERLDRLRAAVATSARFGVFRIEGDRETRDKRARGLADSIRILKGIDPTLGLYAAYAYASADISESVDSVRAFMREDLNTDLFDVALLSGALSGKSVEDFGRLVPVCPMLSQGWELLKPRDVRLAPSVAEARRYLRGALWTTVGRVGMDIIMSELRAGRLR